MSVAENFPDNVWPLHPVEPPPEDDWEPPPYDLADAVLAKPTKADPFANAWTADKLVAEEFPPPRWAVCGLIPEGLAVLAGAPKAGKSWLALNLALAIAGGTTVLGEIQTDAGDVLYLALEDTPRRLQSRMRKILGDQPAPAGLTLLTEFPTLPAGGADAICGWLEARPNARLVVIDVFAKMRGNNAPGVNPYDADYAAMGRAKAIADRFGIAVILVHHLRKMAADDFTAELSGTNGVAGAADTIMALKRTKGEADAVLQITGRDVDEAERAMRFDPANGTWALLAGAALDHTLQPTRAGILAYLRQFPGATPKAISDALGEDRETIRRTCSRMADDGQVRRRDGGRYFPLESRTATEQQLPVPAVPLSQNPT
jgi:hypothetical protein